MDDKPEPKSVFSDQDEALQEAVEDRLLRVKARLIDGSTAKVFSVLPTERGPRWRCHACQVTVLGSRQIYKHERSKEHATVMVETKVHPPENFRPQSPPPPPQQTLLEMSLAPGEPVPPGFEGEVRGVAEIQKKLDAFNSSPLIGLEYLFELHSYDDKEPHYICILCDKRGDPRTVMAHLNSFNHRMKFIESHFPKVNQKISKYRQSKEYKKVCQVLITTLAEWIEKRFGRLVPHACERESFERKRESYTQIVVKDVHFSDKFGETLEEFVQECMFENKEDLPTLAPKDPDQPTPGCKPPEIIKRRSPSPPVVNAPGFKKQRSMSIRTPNRRSDKSPLSSVSSLSLSDDSSPDRSSKYKNTMYHTREGSSYREYGMRRSRSRSSSYSRSRSKKYKYRSRTRSRSPPVGVKHTKFHPGARFPWTRPDYTREMREKSDISNRKRMSAEAARWEEYRKGILKIEDELEHVLRNHEKNPEKHPQYPEEWKKFWNRRYKELQAEHKDPSKHDFKPEWIDYWNKRMKEMHDMEIKARKDALRKRLNLPEEPQPIKFKIAHKKPFSSHISKEDGSLNTSDDIIVIDDGKDDDTNPIRSTSKERIIRKRSHSPWESEYPYEHDRYIPSKREYYPNQRVSDIRSKKYISMSSTTREPQETEDDAQLNIVAVLRLLTALEEKLGSLGPKVIDMLSTALAMEKTEANSAETLLDNDANCVLFETVKEKLKGQLLAGMIEPQAEKPAKNAVKRIASLLHIASERKRKREEENKKLANKLAPLSVPGIGEVDKEAIAKQITAALLAQGRTNVTQEELEQLIGAVVGMAQAKSSGQQVTTAEYAAQMHNPISNTDTTKNMSSRNTSELNQSMDSSAMDGLSDADLKTLLQNFKDLSTDEQHGLISYLKKLEAQDLERVERLRKFVNLEPNKPSKDDTDDLQETSNASQCMTSPFSKRNNDVIDMTDEKDDNKEKSDTQDNSGCVKIDSDEDDDYTYEDVFKAASNNLKEKQLAEERSLMEKSESKGSLDPNVVLKDAKLMIASIMGQLGQRNASSTPVTSNIITTLQEIKRPLSSLSDERPGSSLSFHSVNRSNDVYERNEPRPEINTYSFPQSQDPNFNRDFNNRGQPDQQYSNYSNFTNYNNTNTSQTPMYTRNNPSNYQDPLFKSNTYSNEPYGSNINPINQPSYNQQPYDHFGIESQQYGNSGNYSSNNTNFMGGSPYNNQPIHPQNQPIHPQNQPMHPQNQPMHPQNQPASTNYNVPNTGGNYNVPNTGGNYNIPNTGGFGNYNVPHSYNNNNRNYY